MKGLALAIFLTGICSYGTCQSHVTQPSVPQAGVKGVCSVANTGNNNTITIKCGIDQAHARKMVELLNKILANQIDSAKVMAKLDEILVQRQQAAEVLNAPNGIAIGGGTVNNPTVNNFAPPRRMVTESQRNQLGVALAGQKGSIAVNCPMSDDEGCDYAEQIRASFSAQGWDAGPHVGLTTPSGKKNSVLAVGVADLQHPPPDAYLIVSGLRAMGLPFITYKEDEAARENRVQLYVDANLVSIKP